MKDVPGELLGRQPQIPWRQVAVMRDQLAHRYFDTSYAIIERTAHADLKQPGRRKRDHEHPPSRCGGPDDGSVGTGCRSLDIRSPSFSR